MQARGSAPCGSHLLHCLRPSRRAQGADPEGRDAAGQLELKLKTPWWDGTTHLIMSQLEFMQRLAALVLRPRLHASVTASRMPIPALGYPQRVDQSRLWVSAIRRLKLGVSFLALKLRGRPAQTDRCVSSMCRVSLPERGRSTLSRHQLLEILGELGRPHPQHHLVQRPT